MSARGGHSLQVRTLWLAALALIFTACLQGSSDQGDSGSDGSGDAGTKANRADAQTHQERAGPPLGPGPLFVDVTDRARVRYSQAPEHDSAARFYQQLGLESAPYFTGGAAAGDLDGDGLVDLLVTRLHAPPILFRNRGDGTFADWSTRVGLDAAGPGTVGAALADVDNDGDLDIYFTSIGTDRFQLFINRADGTFADGTFIEEGQQRGAAIADGTPRQGFSAAFGDYDRDGFVDLVTCEWQYGIANAPKLSHTRLLHNRGAERPALAGHFEDVTLAAGLDLYRPGPPPGVHVFSASFSDMDNDGYPDLVVAADFSTSRLFWNNRDGTFSDGTTASGVGLDNHGMGSAIGDYDGDGDLDWFVTSIACRDDNPLCAQVGGNRLYRNEGGRRFTDQTEMTGVLDGGWGWAALFVDFDNDADLDLAMVGGSREPGMPSALATEASRLWRNTGTQAELGFGSEAWPELADSLWTDRGDGKALLTLDYDRDGDMDLFVVDHVDGGRLYKNQLRERNLGGDYLQVQLVGRRSNRSGYGARIELQPATGGPVQSRELRGGSHFISQDESLAHFGLTPAVRTPAQSQRAEGAASLDLLDIKVTWPTPNGVPAVTHLQGVARNQRLTLVEPERP